IEFPHLLRMIQERQFDTIYHEHFSYFSYLTVEKLFAARDLRVFDVEELPTHGGSLRIYVCHPEKGEQLASERCAMLRAVECAAGLQNLETYTAFEASVQNVRM